MKKSITAASFGAAALAIAGCTDAGRGKINNYFTADQSRVTCTSGGDVIYDGFATGKVLSETSSDGYYFIDQDTDRLVEVSGDCIIDYNAKRSDDFQRYIVNTPKPEPKPEH